MVCYSTIQTMLKDGERLMEALAQAGYNPTKVTNSDGSLLEIFGVSAGKRMRFYRNSTTEVFSVSGDTQDITTINRRYAEIGVRAWATKNGFQVTEKSGNKITMVNRRG
jgi:hypothetical protein